MSDNQFRLTMRDDGRRLSEGIMRLGESIPKHDGKLDERGSYTVELWNVNGTATVDIDKDDNVSDYPDHVELTPAQALSLRDWLIQYSPELERLAKEQG